MISYHIDNDAEAAEPFFAEAFRRQPRYERAAWMRALCLIQLDRTDDARRTMEPWLGLIPDPPPRLLLVASIALKCAEGDAIGARQLAQLGVQVHGEKWLEDLQKELDRANAADCLQPPRS